VRDRAEWKSLLLAPVGAAALALLVVGNALTAPRLRAQAPAAQSPAVPQWQIAAGGKMAFDVASIKPSTDSETQHANFPLDYGGSYIPGGGLLTVNKFLLRALIGFAYKLTPYQSGLMSQSLPKALAAERFDVEARAPGNPTKDQMRLMMQALLAERFKLAAHFETRHLPIYGLTLDKPGKPGPQLTPSASAACAEGPPTDGWFQPCGTIGLLAVSVHWRIGARSMSAQQIASEIDVFAPGGTLGRAVVDQTGLSGLYDFRMEFTPEATALPPGVEADPDGQPFVEALKDQLGLKLEPQTGPVDVLVIDHVEEPSPN
jgi:uncharacterized protein (TIGR03435 family)